MKEKLVQSFIEIFGDSGKIRTYFAPGRVNLIGEHTDYNGGHVFPCALTIGTYAVVRKRDDRALNFYSLNFTDLGIIESSLDDLIKVKEHDWANYPKGVIWAFEQKGYKLEAGFDILIYGNIPNGSGLSSSASLEVLTGYIMKDMYGLDVDMIKIALLSQMAENKFVGVNCGIMDQFAIAMGKTNHAIFLDTSNLSYEYAPIQLDNVKIVIANSNKKRGLGESKYNERRAECERALEALKTVIDIKELGNLSEEEFEKYKYVIKDELEQKRAKHAVYENQRTIKAVKALKENKIEEFGKLMIASHNSLRDDYEVTGLELDTLVGASLQQDGVIGSRMTGAGFGGCTVSLVYEDYVENFIQSVGKIYEEKTIYKADFYVVDVGNGPCIL